MFAPIVIVVRRLMGDAKFVRLRGQAIALHSKVITNFCERFGIDRNQRQNMIRVARDNGKRLGLLA
ncbi:electron transporter [Leptothermofonsia sichuanensis E412]|uniref:cyclic electron transport protein PGR5 n=1 Tax=Leptothermofonsia sichuanensis TaxID=2917832 RepID=UPI001CA79372|nr:electron transporter [Leptothermofonsia sichuanensis]QZZ19150.1 electron transporter [Leptothermofonsia sichuanensis E412]